MPSLNLDFIRAQFPAFSEPSLAGQAFFENAGGSYVCAPVIDRLHRYYRETKVQPYAPFPASIRAGREMDASHARLAAYLNVGADEVHFGPSTSQNTYVLAQTFRAGMTEGDEIVVTNQDHEANSGVWRRLEKTGITVREWRVDPQTGRLNPDDLDALLGSRTRLVAFPHCSNIVGHINPVAQITAKIHAAGAIAVVDGVSYAGHGFPDVDALGADVYLFSLYKTYGPHQGLMVARRALVEGLENQGHYFNARYLGKRLTPAGPDHAQIAAAQGIADYFDAVHAHHFAEAPADAPVEAPERGRRIHTLFRAHEQALAQPLLDYVSARGDVRLIGPADAAERAPTVAIATGARHPLRIAETLATHGIMAGAGDFYAVRVIEALGLPANPGVLRLSFVHYTSPVEIDALIAALDATL